MGRDVIDRLELRTLDQRFRQELECGFELAPRVSQGVLDLAKEVFGLDAVSASGAGRLRPGQIRQVITAADVPHGRPLQEMETVEITWTLDAGQEDLEVLREHGRTGLRRTRILRLIDEALDQGGEPTQEDLAKALGVTPRTIRSDIACLEAEGYRVVTRGKLRGVGRGQSHRVAIVELYLRGHTYTEIMRATRHSPSAIKRYLQAFGRVVLLTHKGLALSEIAYVVGISEALAHEYLNLYRRYDLPEYGERLQEMVHRVTGDHRGVASGSKRGEK